MLISDACIFHKVSAITPVTWWRWSNELCLSYAEYLKALSSTRYSLVLMRY